jgi:hypothetical protein
MAQFVANRLVVLPSETVLAFFENKYIARQFIPNSVPENGWPEGGLHFLGGDDMLLHEHAVTAPDEE